MKRIYKDVSEMLGIKYPIIQGGMAWIADSVLAAAVSNGGGLGIIAAGNAEPDVVRKEIRAAKAITDKPFGVNVMLMSPHVEALMDMICEEGVAVVTTGAGNPGKYVGMLKSAGIRVMPVTSSVALASRMERSGVDAVIAEGMESGGHIGESTTMALVPQVVEAVDIPVIAAGGIGDGRGMAAAFMLGASGVQAGTAFLLAEECSVARSYKEMIISAKDSSTVATGYSTGYPARVIKNKMTKEMLGLEKAGISVEEFERRLAGTLRAAAKDGDVAHGSVMAGQIAGLLKNERKAAMIIEEMFMEAREAYENGAFIFGPGSAIPRDGKVAK
jgi:enoyl-[acyl-carrier protein] reductase II